MPGPIGTNSQPADMHLSCDTGSRADQSIGFTFNMQFEKDQAIGAARCGPRPGMDDLDPAGRKHMGIVIMTILGLGGAGEREGQQGEGERAEHDFSWMGEKPA